MVSRDREEWTAETPEEGRGAGVLVLPAAMRQVTAHDDQFGVLRLDQRDQRALDLGVLARPDVEIRDVEHAGRHGRWRL